jgi:cobalt/nickel transport protein
VKKVALGALLPLLFVFSSVLPGWGHFQTIIPDLPLVTPETPQKIAVSLRFMHPFEGVFMPMEKPRSCGVLLRGKKEDLMEKLRQADLPDGAFGWDFEYQLRKPGDHIFYVEPQPYWEPAEDCYIIHYAKVAVNAFGMEKGWSEPAGLRAEIVPLTRPYGLWTGNLFRGKVLIDGLPAADLPVEIEFLNDGSRKAPEEVFITQVVQTDDAGIFSYAFPWGGWWGFAGLAEAPETMKSPDGRDVELELGAVIWVYVSDVQASLE